MHLRHSCCVTTGSGALLTLDSCEVGAGELTSTSVPQFVPQPVPHLQLHPQPCVLHHPRKALEGWAAHEVRCAVALWVLWDLSAVEQRVVHVCSISRTGRSIVQHTHTHNTHVHCAGMPRGNGHVTLRGCCMSPRGHAAARSVHKHTLNTSHPCQHMHKAADACCPQQYPEPLQTLGRQHT